MKGKNKIGAYTAQANNKELAESVLKIDLSQAALPGAWSSVW